MPTFDNVRDKSLFTAESAESAENLREKTLRTQRSPR
jgi:hypothetical protein